MGSAVWKRTWLYQSIQVHEVLAIREYDTLDRYSNVPV